MTNLATFLTTVLDRFKEATHPGSHGDCVGVGGLVTHHCRRSIHGSTYELFHYCSGPKKGYYSACLYGGGDMDRVVRNIFLSAIDAKIWFVFCLWIYNLQITSVVYA